MVSLSNDGRATPGPLMAPAPSRLPAGVGAAAVGFALLSALTTFLVITGHTPIVPTHEVVVTVLAINAILCVLLFGLIVWEVWPLWTAHRRGTAAARLHGRIVGMFCLVAAVPAVVVAIVSSLTLSGGLDRWFSERTRSIVDNAATVARAYLTEHASVLRGEILSMAGDLNRVQPVIAGELERLPVFLTGQANLRGLQVAQVVRADLTVVGRADIALPYQPPAPPRQAITEVGIDDPLMLAPALGSQLSLLGAVIRLQNWPDAYLYVARAIDTRVVRYLADAEEARAEYEIAQLRRTGVQLAFGLMYAGVALILLLSAIWFGVSFANRMVAPIRRLIGASDQVSRGNLYVQVPVKSGEGDLANLSRSFNAMTSRLRTQRDELLDFNKELDERRRFTEAVLSGVSAGVIGLDADQKVTLVNRSGLDILDQPTETGVVGRGLGEASPELAALVAEAATTQRLATGELTVQRRGRDRNLAVRVTVERGDPRPLGYVVTIDDITDLVTAQRSSAWADVARRIAHEIKNPLTPIQLSAERLKRKYGRMIETDRDVFDRCTDTIIRQVGDIGRMVDEFSSFARMPKAQIATDDLSETVRQTVFLMRMGNPDIVVEGVLPDAPVKADFDRRLMSQALTNLVKNATEAVGAVPGIEPGQGRIEVVLREDGPDVVIDVIDNGIGLPTENRQRLLEPYMTTREKGTGLGLAIVRKIIEEHGGGIDLLDAPAVASGGRGAMMRVQFPKTNARAAAANAAPTR